jgi:hypothetical protein
VLELAEGYVANSGVKADLVIDQQRRGVVAVQVLGEPDYSQS